MGLYSLIIKHAGAHLFAMVIVFSTVSCSPTWKGDNETDITVQEEEVETGVKLTAQQMKSVGITIGTIEQKNLTAVVKSSGQLDVPPQNIAKVNVLSGGIVQKINTMEGQNVKKGEILVILENQELLKLQQEYLSAKGGFSYIESEYNRQMHLKKAGAGTGKAQQLAESNYNAEHARINALESQLKQFGISPTSISNGNLISTMPVKAPISGTIGAIEIETGAYVQPGLALMDIVDNSQIHADLIVYEKDLFKVKIGQKVSFLLTNQDNQQLTGKIFGINNSFANDSKGVIVHASINNPNTTLIPGMYITAAIAVGNELSDAVPIEAVVRSAGREFIYIVDEPVGVKEKNGHGEHVESIKFKKVAVTTGISELGYVQLKPMEELPENVKVVAKGAFYLQSKESGPSEHGH